MILIVALIFAVAYWFIESAIDAYLFHRGTLLGMVLTQDPYEYFVRISGAGFILTIGILAQHMVKRIQRTEEQVKRFQRHNELILNSAGEGILGIDQEGKIAFINPAATAVSGYGPDELAGRSFHDLLHYAHADGSPLSREDCPVYHSLRDGTIQRMPDDVFWNKEGKSIPVEYVATPIIEGAKITGAVIVFMDISDRKQAEEEIRRYREHLEKLVAERTGELTRANVQLREEIEDRKRAEQALMESGEKLRSLTSQLMSVQERERSRISAELHDELGQALMVLKMDISVLQDKLRKDQVKLRKDCSRLLSYIDDTVENVRRLCWDLGPYLAEGLSLPASLEYLINEMCKKHNFSCSLNLQEIDAWLSVETQTKIYRILQESLTNIAKHAGAGQISVTLKRDGGSLILEVADQGQGFNLEEVSTRPGPARGLGLTAMMERARQAGGSLDVSSEIGQGTKIVLTLPLAAAGGDESPVASNLEP
ncbi:MAG: PAS domain-containing sensor histidine kinase [Deltaproteobacteria bacterium]|nr:MAG: PAS domain-containing sensor histidine kinase [Deltaproteobacteria bacterium]